MNKLHPNQIGTKLPIGMTCIVLLLLREFEPEQWVHGVTWTLVALVWVGCIVSIYKETWHKLYK